jgi:hypothetical protein
LLPTQQSLPEEKIYFIFWENVSPEATRVLLNKRLFGYTANGKQYLGAVQKLGCRRLGKGCISIPFENLRQIVEIFDSLNVSFKVREVVDFGEKTIIEA